MGHVFSECVKMVIYGIENLYYKYNTITQRKNVDCEHILVTSPEEF